VGLLLSIHYLIWLVLSAACFASGEYFSKKFALEPGTGYLGLIFLMYGLGVLAWLPALMQRNQLSIVGTIWSVLSLLATVLIGVLIFSERLSIVGVLGIIAAIVAIVLLSIS